MNKGKDSYKFFKSALDKLTGGDYKGAIDDLDKAIAIEPRNPNYFWKRGIAKSRLGDNKGANEDFLNSANVNNMKDKLIDLGKDEKEEKIKEKKENYIREREAIDNSDRTIRLAIQLSEMRSVSRDLSHKLGRQPSRKEMADAMGIAQKDLEDLISQSAPCASLDAHARGEEDRSTLGELIPDPNSEDPMEGMDRAMLKEHLGTHLSQLDPRYQKIMKLRFGLDGQEPLTLAEIGRQIGVSRERVRQLESKAKGKLREMANRQQAA